MTKAKPLLIFLAKVTVSGGLLLYFLSRIEIGRFWQTLLSADYRYVVLALVVYLGSQLVSVVRWWVLARPLAITTRFSRLIFYYLIGMFFNLFAPGTVGGDFTRVYYLARDDLASNHAGNATLHSTLSVLMDRAVGMVVLVWLAALGLISFPGYGVPETIRKLTFAMALVFLIGGALMPVWRRILPDDGHSWVVKLRVALRCYRLHVGAVGGALLLSLIVHLIQAWMHVVLGWALHLSIPFSFCIILYPLVGTFASIPVTLNGLGLREGGYLFLLPLVGINSEQGIAFGLLLFVIVALDSLLGGIVFLLRQDPKPTPQAVEANG